MRGLLLATAESCTGGMVAAAITDVAGSSAVFDRGFVTYSNAAKTAMLGVSPALLERHGAVSEETARAMAEGALRHSAAQVTVAITGIAGPGGGSRDKPVGLVHFAVSSVTETRHVRHVFDRMSRVQVRLAAAETALQLILDAL